MLAKNYFENYYEGMRARFLASIGETERRRFERVEAHILDAQKAHALALTSTDPQEVALAQAALLGHATYFEEWCAMRKVLLAYAVRDVIPSIVPR